MPEEFPNHGRMTNIELQAIDPSPFHLFEHQGRRCVINIEEMRAQSVDEDTTGVLDKLNAESNAALQSGMAEQLTKLGLIANGGGQAKNDVKKEPAPIVNMALFLTQSCNLNCIYRYGEGREYVSGGSLEEKTAYQAADWLIERSGKKKRYMWAFSEGNRF